MLGHSSFIQHSKIQHSRQTGFSLVEILVSVVILSFGLLGLAGLQASALKMNRQSQYQSTAVLFAQEYAELMRNNHAIAQKKSASGSANPYLIAATATIPTTAGKSCIDNRCSANDMASWDRQDWLMRLATRLPNPKVEVCFDNAPYEVSGADAGLPKKWGACSNTGSSLMIKIGWQSLSAETQRKDADTFFVGQLQDSERPEIVLPVTPGGAFDPNTSGGL